MPTDLPYEVVTQYETVEFMGGTQTRPVVAVGARTKAHGVYFEFRVPKADYSAAVVRNDAGGYTIIFEMLFDIPGVADAEWTQEPTANGMLEDHVIVYFTSSSGASSSSVDVPYRQFDQRYISALVGYYRAELDAVENGETGPAGGPPTYAATTGSSSSSVATASTFSAGSSVTSSTHIGP